ncbi:MAG: endonuclease/exonuclease/phosphatase family protein [Mycobacterium kyogaense]|uniref:endonuclease/exonuclease/phosphatase family protein n=1 Tax=Mycobacterium kyogaense TaxID=2212479 RepID=UPI002FF56675
MRAFLSRQRRRLTWTLRPQRVITVTGFDERRQRWVAVETSPSVERDDVTFATFNVWFGDYHATARYQAIADLLEMHTPDVIALQEMTPVALEVFLAQPWIRLHYVRVAATGEDFGRYGLVILSRLPVSHAVYTHLPRSVGRGLLQANLTINGRTLTICSLHLASGKTASELRARQLATVLRTVDTAENAVLLGDFNLRTAEALTLPASLRDAWLTLHPSDEGFTEDTSINLMLSDKKNKRRQERFDRVLVKGDRWAPAHIQLLGTGPISPTLPRVFPSDHFGLLCRLEHVAGTD